MLCRKFELIPIKIGFFTNFYELGQTPFKVAQKLGQTPCTIYSTGSLAKFHQKWLGENSPFL